MPEDIKREFKANTNNWVKIWFSTKPTKFMPEDINEQFLILALKNPTKRFILVYSSTILDENGQKELEDSRYIFEHLNQTKMYNQVTFLDIDSPEFYLKLKDHEQELFNYARAELASLANGGNPAAASDIIRILSPCFTQGHYTDFDVPLNFSELSTTDNNVNIPRPVLIPIKGSNYCNDVIVVAENAIDSELSFITAVQQEIVSAYKGDGLKNISNKMMLDKEQEEQFEQMIQTAKKSASNPLLALRAAIKDKLDTSNTKESLSHWRQLYMHSVMQTTGPGVYERVRKRLLESEIDPQVSSYYSRMLGEFGTIATSQVTGQANDASWVPQAATPAPILESTEPLKEKRSPQESCLDSKKALQQFKVQAQEDALKQEATHDLKTTKEVTTKLALD